MKNTFIHICGNVAIYFDLFALLHREKSTEGDFSINVRLDVAAFP